MNPAIGHENKHIYEFGAFRLDPVERILASNGERIPLAPKAFDTLVILLQHSGHALTKVELLRTVWPDTFVEENNLTQHISLLRKALASGSEDREYIETVPKLGYRFVCEVREIDGDASASPSAPHGASAGTWTGENEVVVSKRTRTHIVLREVEEEFSDEPAPAETAVSHQPVGIEPQAIQEIETERSLSLQPQAKWRPKSVFIAVTLISLSLAVLAI